ncbi:hypothetical protein ACMXYR_11390 [Neptuniibacter sp. QD29_5]|uniref:hypothetical protein n=1 Tax=Neptuniibacter sp. QD29_5 TaxID=3398207 RepID=UPI0039F4FF28
MDPQVTAALSMLEAVLASGDEEQISQQILEMRATGIFSPEMYEHLNNLNEPSDQLKAIIDAIRMEELVKQGVTSKEIAAMEVLSKMTYEEQLNTLKTALDQKEKTSSTVVKNSGANLLILVLLGFLVYLINKLF